VEAMSKAQQNRKDILWSHALKKSGVEQAYVDFATTLAVRHAKGKKGDDLISDGEYELLTPLAKAERKLYSLYTGREVESYGDLSDEERVDISARLRTAIRTISPITWITVEYAKSIVDTRYKSDEVEGAGTDGAMAEALATTLLAESRYEKSAEGLSALFDHVLVAPDGTKVDPNRVAQPKAAKRQVDMDNVVTTTALGLVAADALVSIFSSNSKKEEVERGEDGQPKSKLTFRRVLSVAAAIGTAAVIGMWTHRLATQGRTQRSNEPTLNP